MTTEIQKTEICDDAVTIGECGGWDIEEYNDNNERTRVRMTRRL